MSERAAVNKSPREDISKMSAQRQRMLVRWDWQRIRDIPNPDESVQLEAITASRYAWTGNGQNIPDALLEALDLSSPRILEALIFADPRCYRSLRIKQLPLSVRHQVLAEALANEMGISFFFDSRPETVHTDILVDDVRKAKLLVRALGIESLDKPYADTLECAYLGVSTEQGLKDLNHLVEAAQVAAVRRAPAAIQFITSPAEAVQFAAVPRRSKPAYSEVITDWGLIGLIDAPCQKLQLYALTRLPQRSSAHTDGLVARLSGEVKQAYSLATTGLGLDPDSPRFVELLAQIYAGLQNSQDEPGPTPG